MMDEKKKYSLLIAEDNPREEREMVRILKNRMPCIEITGLFPDGQAAFLSVCEKKPDIILTDIVMPKMNGVQLAEQTRAVHPAAQIIFTSCHNDFNFAKSAIDLRVHSYVLKPVMEEELVSAVEKALRLLDAEQQREQERTELLKKVQESIPVLREQFLRDLFFSAGLESSYIEQNLSFLQFDLPDPFAAQIMVLSMHSTADAAAPIDEKYITDFKIQSIVHSYADTRSRVYAVKISDTEFAVAVFLSLEEAENPGRLEGTQAVECTGSPEGVEVPECREDPEGSGADADLSPLDVCISIKEKIDEETDFEVKAGISTEANRVGDIAACYKEAVQALRTKFVGGPSRTVLYEDIEAASQTVFEGRADLQEVFERIRDMLEFGQRENVGVFLEDYLGNSRPKSEHYVKNIAISVVNLIQIVLTEQNEMFENIFGKNYRIWQRLEKIESLIDLKKWLEDILCRCIEYLEKARNTVYERVAEDIKRVVREKYGEHITVSDIAALVNYSPSQANVIFKKSTGTTIFDYLSEYRLDRAKELLGDPYSRVYLVADAVGYKNKSHFCLQFKKYTGLSPSQYKDRVSVR